MVIDTSSFLTILQREPERQTFLRAIEQANIRVMSTACVVETSMVVLARKGEEGVYVLQALMRDLHVEQVALTADHAQRAIDAFRRFGKGRHAADLNFGDCFSYALAKATGEPLLFKGDDFSRPISSEPYGDACPNEVIEVSGPAADAPYLPLERHAELLRHVGADRLAEVLEIGGGGLAGIDQEIGVQG
ncbi:MAG: PilT protein domain protein [Caulobacteraceae bacterium]|nr:PilT protein domain protein [Caulobacteraceae bacterium]